MKRLLVLVLELVLGLVIERTAYAQQPTDAGASEGTYGCVEQIPRGAQKPGPPLRPSSTGQQVRP